MRTRIGGLALALAACVATAVVGAPAKRSGPLSSQLNRPWPVGAEKVADGLSRPLTAAEELRTFHMPPGYRVELVASEPLVHDPVLMEFDGDGRLWVLEMEGFAINEHMDNSFEPINNLVVLEDTNHDGVYDKRTVFMDKLVMPRAFKILDKNCALVGAPPNLFKACDTNGDLKADTREVIDKTFSTQGVVEHGANGLYWGMDNLIRVSEHTWDLRPKGNSFETVPSLNRGQWGVTQDDAGRIYRNVNTDPLFVDYVAPQYYVRNPNLVRTSGLYENLAKQEESMIWPARPTFGLNRGYRTEALRKDGSATYYGGVSSPMFYRGTRLPKDIQGQPFVVDSPTNLVHLLRLNNDGAGRLSTSDFYKRGEFLASTDERFRPVSLTPGWDGAFYIADMYRGVSQDGPLQTDYLRSYINQRKLWNGTHYGRIYRVVYQGMTFDQKPHMSSETPAQLVAHLSHPNGWWRDTAQQLLVQRGDRSVVPALAQLAASSPDYRTKLHALWTLNGLGALDQSLVLRALEDPSPDVRASAVRLSEHWLGNDGPIRTAVMRRMDDANWLVRRQLAASLGELPREARLQPIMAMMRRYGDDKVVVDAAASGLAGQELDALKQLVAESPAGTDAIATLAAATGKRRDAAAAQALLAMGTDPKQNQAVRTAVLQGLTDGLSGAGGGDDNFVAGGRAGAGIAGAGQRRNNVQELQLAAEPRTLVGMAAGKGNDAAAAAKLVALLSWPAKPPPPAIAPRTPEEEALYVAGRTLFTDNCAGCHTPEGRGAGNVAADLAGSRLVNASGSVPVRILSHGKEGKIGLMPPAGATMSDREIASVVTYIRGSFGNHSSPVAEPLVKEWRQAYAYRKSPWTDAELLATAR